VLETAIYHYELLMVLHSAKDCSDELQQQGPQCTLTSGSQNRVCLGKARTSDKTPECQKTANQHVHMTSSKHIRKEERGFPGICFSTMPLPDIMTTFIV